MAADLNTLRGTIGMLPTGEDIAGLRLQLEQTRGSVDRHAVRLTSIEGAEQSRRVVQAERTQQQAIKTLEASVTLPFRVLALDRWGGKPYVTVAPPGVNVLETMGVGDKRAGWELKTIAKALDRRSCDRTTRLTVLTCDLRRVYGCLKGPGSSGTTSTVTLRLFTTLCNMCHSQKLLQHLQFSSVKVNKRLC